MSECVDSADTVLLDVARHEAPDGTLFAVRQLGVQARPGVVSRRCLDVCVSHDGGRSWSAVSLRVCPLHLHRAKASEWPPPAALSSSLSEGRLCIEYDSVYDPWAKAAPTRLQAHARWQGRYDPRLRWWTLHQLRLHGPDAPVTR